MNSYLILISVTSMELVWKSYFLINTYDVQIMLLL